jgi:diguanylate cyclase (GGDEF)-like protein
MSSMPHASQDATAVRARGRPRNWSLWTIPKPAIALVLVVDLLAIVGVLVAVLPEPPKSAELGRFFLLIALCVVFGEASDRSDRMRQYLGSDRAWVDTTSVWAVAAAMTLPTGWSGLCVIGLNLHTLERGRRQHSVRAHRIIYSGAVEVLATLAAAQTRRSIRAVTDAVPAGPRSLLAVSAALACFIIVNLALVYLVIYLVMRPNSWREVVLSYEELVFEIATLVLGVLTAQVVLRSPWLTPGVLLVLALLYRGAMVTQLQVESTIDAKTGLLNFTSWRDLATRALLRTQRTKQPVAVMLIDLDHFKRVNDTYAHLVGDQVLSAVADCVKSDLREYDMVGRFGGEEFVLLLDNADLYAAVTTATRLRQSISDLSVGDGVRITASIGVAHSAQSSAPLDALLERADVALYEAKSAGRNTVRALAAFAGTSGDAVA